MDVALPALVGFALAATITPGPNNVMVMASGANFGLGRTVPHLLGIATGVLFIMALVGVGLIALLDAIPALRPALDVLSTAYLLWLAWKIARAQPPGTHQPPGRPLTFIQAALFQLVNPKVWATGLSAVTLFAPDRALQSLATVAAALSAAGLGSNVLWAVAGTALQGLLRSGPRLRVFNLLMAAALVASLAPALFQRVDRHHQPPVALVVGP